MSSKKHNIFIRTILYLTDKKRRRSRFLNELLSLTNKQNQPNINELWSVLQDMSIIRLNIKNYGYDIARKLQPLLAQIKTEGQPIAQNLVSKPTTQKDIESPWFVYWCREIKAAPVYHRKLWEFAFTLQALYELNMLQDSRSGIGFGCGEEPLASYFASRGIRATITDLEPERAAKMGWAETGQHTASKESAFFPDIVSHDAFESLISHRYMDMNNLPEFNTQYDFCWSICALEHLGSIKKGLAFIENSIKALKPGGVAIHTTEYNYLSEDKTIDNWPTVLFLRRHFEELAKTVTDAGHEMLGPEFDVGDNIMDKFIDISPYSFEKGWLSSKQYGSSTLASHLKLSVDGFAVTCFGIIIRKGLQ